MIKIPISGKNGTHGRDGRDGRIGEPGVLNENARRMLRGDNARDGLR